MNPKTRPFFSYPRIVIAIFFLSVIVVYAPSLSGPFLWDDEPLITENTIVKDPGPILRSFLTELHPNTHTNYYRPVVALSFMANYFVFKLNPLGYHVTNVFLHFLTGVFLFWALLLLTGSNFLSFTTCLLFLIHPVHCESVAYISGRADPLAAMFVLSSLVCYIKSAASDSFENSRSSGYSYLSWFLFALALLSKEVAVMFPFALLGVDMFIIRSYKKRFIRISPFFIIVFLYIILRLGYLNFSPDHEILSKKGFAFFDIGLIARSVIFLKTLVIYIGTIFIPLGLHMERILEFEKIHIFYLAGAAIFLICYFAARSIIAKSPHEKRGLLNFSLFWFFVWLLPQSAFVFPRLMADHFLYLPSMGIFLLVALCVHSIDGNVKKNLTFVPLCVYLGIFTISYSGQWRDEFSFFSRIARLAPASYRVHENLAAYYLKNSRLKDAILEYRLIIDPEEKISKQNDFVFFADEILKFPIPQEKRGIVSAAFYNIGVIYSDMKMFDEAIKAYAAALKVNPESAPAYNNLGLIYEKMLKLDEAEAFYRRSITSDRLYVRAYNNLGELYARRGDYKKAITLWQKALEIEPGYETAKKNIFFATEPNKND